MTPDAQQFERFLTAIATTGFETDWHQSGKARSKERFFICRADETIQRYGDPALVHAVTCERNKRAHTAAAASDWSNQALMDFCSDLTPEETAWLPCADPSLPCVRTFRQLVQDGPVVINSAMLTATIHDGETAVTSSGRGQWDAEALLLAAET